MNTHCLDHPAGGETETDLNYPCPLNSTVVNFPMHQKESIPTRASLLERLKDMSDQSSWNEFYELYHNLIFSVARRAGLNETESGEVVQDTLISVARKMPGFTYDPAKDSFKGWLLTVTRWRIRDRLAKRHSGQLSQSPRQDQDSETRTATIDRVSDPAGPELASIWEEEWESQLLQAALARIKRQVQPHHYQIYHLHVLSGQPVREVARALGTNTAQIYLAKHRVGNLLKKEIKKLSKGLL